MLHRDHVQHTSFEFWAVALLAVLQWQLCWEIVTHASQSYTQIIKFACASIASFKSKFHNSGKYHSFCHQSFNNIQWQSGKFIVVKVHQFRWNKLDVDFLGISNPVMLSCIASLQFIEVNIWLHKCTWVTKSSKNIEATYTYATFVYSEQDFKLQSKWAKKYS